MKLSDDAKHKSLFCVFAARGYSPEEAARCAGFGPDEYKMQAAILLDDSTIRKKIAKLVKQLKFCSPAELARAGLERLALGDAEFIPEEPELGKGPPSLFHVSEIRRPKGGGIEIKYFDRLKALSLLAELDKAEEEPSGSLLEALERSACALTEDGPGHEKI